MLDSLTVSDYADLKKLIKKAGCAMDGFGGVRRIGRGKALSGAEKARLSGLAASVGIFNNVRQALMTPWQEPAKIIAPPVPPATSQQEKVPAPSGQSNVSPSIIVDWREFYSRVFNLKVDLSGITVPSPQKDFFWAVFVLKELGSQPLNTVVAACRKRFPVCKYLNELDMDVSITINERDLKDGSYAIRARNRMEADKENKRLSADDIDTHHLFTATLLERFIMELFYSYYCSGKHLDIRNTTLCSGSRFSDGDVPCCFWNDGKFEFNWVNPSRAYENVRARSVIT